MYGRLWLVCPAAFLLAIGNTSCLGDGGGSSNFPGCTEDAFSYTALMVAGDSVTNRDSACPSVKPRLESRLARFSFTNTHSTRGIAIAAALIEQSDIESFPVGTCALALQQGAVSSPPECHPGIGEVCSSPVSFFLAPGQSSDVWQYQCMQEQLYPSRGDCSALQVETLSWSVFAHAVFCEGDKFAHESLCGFANPRLLQGQPVPNSWIPVENGSCPAG